MTINKLFNLEGKTALVTGAGSGIGQEISKTLYNAGANLALAARRKEKLEETQTILSNKSQNVEIFSLDVTEENSIKDCLVEINKKFPSVDILVNNAGMVQIGNDQPSKKFIEHSLESWNYGIDINLKSTFLVTRNILPHLKKQKSGRIINISSVTGPVVGISGSTVYGSAKAAMLGLTRSLAIEEGKNGITVNCVGPGWIKTGSSSEAEITAGKFTPIGRPGIPEEIGHTVLFLASEEASYITGQIIFVDGGNTIQEYKVELGK